MQFYCPQCGEDTETLHEGYCEECCRENQAALDAHNASFAAWQRMSDVERDRAIKEAIARDGYLFVVR